MKINLTCVFLFLAQALLAQTASNAVPDAPVSLSNAAPTSSPASTNQTILLQQQAEKIRAECIQGRRSICGKILKVLPDGLVVDSGYTNLMRHPLDRSWLVPGAATASKAPNLVEGREPGSICVGLVFLTNTPKSRRVKPRQYDYVIIQGYPAGEHTYKSVGTVEHTVRRFSASLSSAVALRMEAVEKAAAPATEAK